MTDSQDRWPADCGTYAGGSTDGVFTANVGTLSNDFFINILDMSTKWSTSDKSEESFEGTCRKSGKVKFTGTRADLVFGPSSTLRGLAEVYAESGSKAKFTADFIAAWHKVMMNDRFDVKMASNA